jgi:hypothetical protein
MKMIAFEKEIMERMVSYRQKTISCNADEFELEKTLTYREHILQMEELLTNTIKKFKELENKSK